MVGIAKGDAAHFDQNRAPLKILSPTHKKTFLRMPGHFVLDKILGSRKKNRGLEPADSEIQIRVALAARSKTDLAHGNVTLADSPRLSRGISLDALSDSIDNGRAAHAQRLEQLRHGLLDMPPWNEWARLWLRSLGYDATRSECVRVAEALEAARNYEMSLWKLAASNQYDFERHASDWIDGQHLYYLCDPSIQFVVRDAQVKKRAGPSVQCLRILAYDAVRDQAMNS